MKIREHDLILNLNIFYKPKKLKIWKLLKKISCTYIKWLRKKYYLNY